MTTNVAKSEFEFDLIFALPDDASDEPALLDGLCGAGCGDAVVGLGAPGLVGLGFRRTGREAETVISATVQQVMRGLPDGATLREVRTDTVSLA